MRRRSLLLGLIVPLALLAGQLSTIVHSTLVEHERCREHGEMVHRTLGRSDDDALLTPTPAALPAAVDRRAHVAPDADPADGHGHDHCLSLTNRRDGLRPAEAPAAAVAALDAVTVSPLATLAPVASVGLFRLAPKTSPPRSTVTA